ncbi:hypothetical protein [Hymenobacter sp. UYP22]|uniref:hypothetical protein n=1 Tax=Hymenobacter sp. UYP22 TaxID=3156348 RepID=UPI003391247C
MEKLTRHTSFLALKTEDNMDTSAAPSEKMLQFEQLMAALRTGVSTKNKRVGSGK